MAGVDSLNDLIPAPGHSPAELRTVAQTSTHTLKLCLLAIAPCQSWPQGRRKRRSFLCSEESHLLPTTSGKRRSMQSTQDSSVSVRMPYGCKCEAIHCLSRQSEWWKEQRADSVQDEGGAPLTLAIVSSPRRLGQSPQASHKQPTMRDCVQPILPLSALFPAHAHQPCVCV